MRNLRKLSYVACAVFFFTSCEETYNDKLFWPGEISQEYGSYIKPYTLDLTYSGEKLIGKTVSFKTEDSETGTLTLNNIMYMCLQWSWHKPLLRSVIVACFSELLFLHISP